MGANCIGSRSEVGCLRFDVLRASTESDLFVSYEAPEKVTMMIEIFNHVILLK